MLGRPEIEGPRYRCLSGDLAGVANWGWGRSVFSQAVLEPAEAVALAPAIFQVLPLEDSLHPAVQLRNAGRV